MNTNTSSQIERTRYSFLLEVAVLFFLILSIPYDLALFESLSNGSVFSFENLFQLATYRTSFVPESEYAGGNVIGYYNWIIALFVAVVFVVVFGRSTRNKLSLDDDSIYHWLRVLLRYRLALAITFIGIVKVIPIQIPEPTLSELHTEYGDFMLWKLYYLTNGIATAGYLPVIGALEVVAGLFLLNRRTAVIGAGLLLATLLNVVIVNYVYEIGEQVYSSFLLLVAFTIFLHDLPRFFNLLVKNNAATPDQFIPHFTQSIWKYRPYLQVVFLIIIGSFSIVAYGVWKDSNYPFPKQEGVSRWKGVYDVEEFVWNGDSIAHSLTDSLRWKDVVFEAWNTVSVRSNLKFPADSLKPKIAANRLRDYEFLGNGSRKFFSYTYKKEKGKRTAKLKLTDRRNSKNTFTFSVKEKAPNILILSGSDQLGNSLNVTLQQQQKRYLIKEGRRNPIKIY